MAGDWIKTGLVQLTLWRNPNHFEPYWKWEDYHAGMYRDSQEDLEEKIQSAVSVLGSDLKCKEAMERVVLEWPVSSALNLHDATKNVRPWLGRAACCITYGCCEGATRQAWWLLSETQRDRANAIADCVIAKWRQDNA
jgi:hypothetical protein